MKFPIPGDKKVKRKFLFLPQGPEGDTRWLEFADVEYIYTKRLTTDYTHEWYWKPVRFLS